MDDSLMDDSVFDIAASDSDAFSPEKKPAPKSKPVAKPVAKKTAAAAKPKPVPKKLSQTTLKPSKLAPKKRAKPESDEENSEGEDIPLDDDDALLSNTPPSAKRQKKTGPKKAPGKPLAEVQNESFVIEADSPKPKSAKKSGNADEKYQKLTPLQHILVRPDTYIGSVERTESKMWVYNSELDQMENREVSYVPGLYKIFDEILVNAADNKQNDKNMDEIRVVVDVDAGEISVRNNGHGIPIEMHAKEGIYIPEMIFGHLLTSSNYNDDQAKVTGGRNGYGAKLCNVFSTHFTLETQDSRQKKRYKQTWTENMSKMGKASITTAKGDDYTKVTFRPDLRKFGMDKMDADFEALVKRRVYDMAGTCKGVKVYLNDKKIAVRSFKKYMEMYTKALKSENLMKEDGTPDAQVILTDNPHERWEIGFAVSDGSFQQVSFVNSIATTSGGSHVNYIADQIVDKLAEIVKKKNKGGVALKPAQIRNHIFLFVNCLITNPAFSSQTKEQMTTKASQFGSKCTVSDNFLKAIAKTEAVSNIIHFAQQKADQLMKKSDGNRRTRMNHSKLTDANKAGTKDGWQCTLILTEGDSASLLALAGRAVVDPDRIGVFPLRGKVLNVRDASVDQITKNAEIQNIKKFMGLQHKKHYDDARGLRYGHLMIMTDQDHDGSHIKGLLINFLECQYPSLLKIPGFLQEFITPIVKVWKGDPKHPKKLQSFFTMPEYEAWKEEAGNQRGWEHKYFKGLGTSSPSDAEIYFRDLDRHLKEFATMQPDEPALIDMAFSKKKADARKEWLRQFVPGTFLDMRVSQITYNDFINKELILFSIADNMRSIPSVIDGFKPGQRKVLYTCFRRNLKKDVKVVELAGSVSGLTAYAYGDTSLQQTIVGLAQTFVGSNNINTLEPSGNFGSRLQGGSDCASARYIYTRLSPFARKVFHTKDEPLLSYNMDDGKTIEPEMYVPVVPMILVNGADGIGTGWSTSIPNYNPEDIVANLKARMEGDKDSMTPMTPWFRGFTGQVEDLGGDRFKFSGIIRQTGDNEIEVTELPVRMWTQDFKDKLEEIIKAEKTPASFIKDYTEYNTPLKVHFIIKMEDKHMKVALERGLDETFKLQKSMATSNLVAFDSQGRIHKYATPLDILEEFYQIRVKFYEQRKAYMLNEMQQELEKLNNQARFIKMIIDGKLVVSKKKKAVLVAELQEKGFKAIAKLIDARKEGEFEAVVDEIDAEFAAEEAMTVGANDYDYLLGMAIWSLTQERIDRLMKQVGDKEEEIDILVKTSPKQLWLNDLDEFIAEWRFQLEDEAKRAKESLRAGRRASTKLRIGGKKGAKKRKTDDSDASDDEFEVSRPKKAAKPKPQSMLASYFDKNDKKPPASKTLVNAFELNPVAPPPAKQLGLLPDSHSEAPSDVDKKPTLKAAPKPAAKPTKRVVDLSDDDDDDIFAAIAKKSSADTKAPVRAGRAAARKPVKYALGSDDSMISSDGEDMLGDVGGMVKGISGASAAAGPSKSLFTETASRPSSSSSHSHSKPSFVGRASVAPVDSDIDETDYKRLAPSPQKPAARKADLASDDSDDDVQLVSRPTAKPKATVAASKPKPKTAPKKASTATAAHKATVLSPAAKAYAAKQAKAQALLDNEDNPPPARPKFAAAAVSKAKPAAVTKGKKKAVVSDDEDDMDVDDIANEILEDDDDDESVVKPTARPARRAVATKKSKYVVDDDEDDSEMRDFVNDDVESDEAFSEASDD